MQINPAACKRAAPPHRREGNTKPRALPATAGFAGRLSKYCEHSESEPILAVSRGKVAKSAGRCEGVKLNQRWGHFIAEWRLKQRLCRLQYRQEFAQRSCDEHASLRIRASVQYRSFFPADCHRLETPEKL